ncbi:MAG TPA: hypothetical protein VKI65_10520, partial [Gemmataceae bacterium]|nr:hypothetical protein [Gemmataceae bacterium]
DLDSNEFATRQRADRELEELEELAEPALRKAVAENAAPEVRRRAETLLAKLDTNPPSAKILQALRAVEVLEHSGTPEAQELLKRLAISTPAARLTQEAKAALERLAKRPASKP